MAAFIHRLRLGEGHALITTIGARTGRRRSIVVRPFPEETGSVLVVAFKPGATTRPSWFLNMAQAPQSVWIEESGARVRVSAVVLEGEDRERAWQRILAEAPVFSPYRDRAQSEVAVVRLKPVDS
jgi:deazaflavin-dependent oxidoreductase (nitroreductase family)